MRNEPSDKYDREELERINAEKWMIDCLGMNPNYTCWGPYEDYMTDEKSQWSSRQIFEDWKSFGPWNLDELNEVVNFYFDVNRASVECIECNGSGSNPETKKLSDDWYNFDNPRYIMIDDNRRYNDNAWSNHIEQIEVDALWKAGRLKHDFKEKPTPAQVNEWNKTGMGHDAINQWICVEARATQRGVYGLCETCEGHGSVYTEPAAKLGLVLWVLHPRKGCSRGIHIQAIKKDELTDVTLYLKQAADRNSQRFSNMIVTV